MPNTIEALEKKLKEVEGTIQETRERLPAHSVKPPIMMELLDLEDEAHALRKKIDALKRGDRHGA